MLIINNQQMDIKDFQGVKKFKYLVPSVYIINWILMWVGPIKFPITWHYICIFTLCYINWKTLVMIIISVIAYFKSKKVLDKVEDIEKYGYRRVAQIGEELFYAFIIPSYNEDIDLLSDTLNVLAEHRRAKAQYLVFMAMEEHEPNSDQKAMELIRRFEGKFKLMGFTVHKVRQYEQKGKASNVSWCAEHLEPIFKQNLIEEQQVFLTIIDADSWAPNIYFDEMEEHIIKNWEKRHTFIYQPPQMFSRNHMDVPMMVRAYDLLHGTMHFTNLQSMFGITFPLSNYSLSFNLIKRIGFWDTCADAIGEDFHTTEKAFWKTSGEVQCIPIFAIFNQVNISTGKGVCADIKARFWQAERHARGVADTAWNLNFFFRKPFNFKCFWMMFQIVQNHCLPGILPWVCFSINFQSKYFASNRPQEFFSELTIAILFNTMSIGTILAYYFYEFTRRRATRVLYNLQVQALWHIVEYPIFFTINLFGISIPTFILAAFGALRANQVYHTAEKVIVKDKDHHIHQ